MQIFYQHSIFSAD